MTTKDDLKKIYEAAIEADHPLPDENSIAGARQIKGLLEGTTSDDLTWENGLKNILKPMHRFPPSTEEKFSG